MKTFGLNIRKSIKYDAKNVVARLFLCPGISTSQAKIMLDNIVEGKIPINNFLHTTDTFISNIEKGDGFKNVMTKKLATWEKTFGTLNDEDYQYIQQNWGFTVDDLLNKQPSSTQPQSPKDLANYVKAYVKGQDEAIERLSVPFYLHLDSKRKKYTSRIKTPVLLMGQTGTGKSEIFRRFAEVCDCPVIRINTSEIVPSGWRGLHLSDILLRELNNNTSIEDLKCAVLVFHEFDKITHYGQKMVGESGSDITIDMIRDIMRLFETDHSIHLETDNNPCQNEKYRLPVDNLFVVFDGAFSGIETIIQKRMTVGSTMGFQRDSGTARTENYMKYVTTEDLLQWGYTPELLGRLSETIVLNKLSSDTIYEIMTSAKDSILKSHIDFCHHNNIELTFEESALRYVADEAYKSGLGFRNVKTLFSKVLNKLYYEISSSKEKKNIEITKEYMMNNLNVK